MRTILVFLFLVLWAFDAKAQTEPCATTAEEGQHVVQKGETLYGISKRYKTTLDNLRKWNRLDKNSNIGECAALWVRQPKAAPAPVEHSTPTSTTTLAKTPEVVPAQQKPVKAHTRQPGNIHMVQAGETVESVAKLYGYTAERFRAFNNLSKAERVAPGMSLRSSDCVCPTDGTAFQPETDPLPAQYDLPAVEPTPAQPNAPETSPVATQQYSYQYDQGTYKQTEVPTQNNTPPANLFSEQPASSTPTTTAQADQPAQYDANAYDLPGYYARNQRQEGGNDWFEDRESASARLNDAPRTDEAAPPSVAPASYLKPEELKMLDEINLVRGNPSGYIPYVEAYITLLKQNGDTGNGIRSAYELIDELRKTPRLSVLQPAECLYRSAQKHGVDEKKRGTTGHEGSDGSWPWDRVLRECPQFRDGNENLVGGPADIRRAVMLLLVDDGIEGRGHRATLLDPNWRYAVCHKVGQVGNIPNCWVQTFAY